MHQTALLGVVYDTCGSCGSVFLTPEDAAAKDVDVGLLFGGGPGSGSLIGPSERRCPAHRTPMSAYRVIAPTGALTVERADCCGGVFLDPGEDSPLLAAAQRAARLASMATAADGNEADVIETASGARFAAPPPAKGGAFGAALSSMAQMNAVHTPSQPPYRVAAGAPSDRTCPRCRAPYRVQREDGLEIDICSSCGSMFLDAHEVEAKGVPTALLFGVGPQAAKDLGVSALRCPRCGDPMRVFSVAFIAGPIEVDRALCCGGLFLDGGEQAPLLRAARRAENEAADAHYAVHGEYAGDSAMNSAIAHGGGLDAMVVNTLQRQVDSMMLRMIEDAQRRADAAYYD